MTALADRHRPRLAAALALLAAALLPAAMARANPVQADHVQVALLARETAIEPGGTVELGIHFELEDGWHVYWVHPGDSGEAPRVKWDLPDGFAPGTLGWPMPRRIASGPLVNYGYEGEVLLPVTVAVERELPGVALGQQVALTAEVSWLVCHENCIPGQATLELRLPVQGAAAGRNPEHEPLFARAHAEQPIATRARVWDEGATLLVEVETSGAKGEAARYQVIPRQGLTVVHAAAQEVVRNTDGAVAVRVQKDDTRSEPLTHFAGVLVATGDRQRNAYAFEAEIQPAATTTNTPAPAKASTGLLLALALAFGGGLLLNLMPCVFPVLSLKVLGFWEHAHDKRAARRHGWAYTAGVMLSFWLLAGLLLLVRASTRSFGWGFQLQSPVFVSVLALLIFVFALNLLGAFEIGLALTRMGGLGGTQRGLVGSFVTGVLATVVATPCTAPFMGTALGWALSQPAVPALLVFTALGLGMAAPYVALSHFPSLIARLPRPGRWMETLRQAMAFPLFATVIWLLAVFTQLTAAPAVFELMTGLLLVALGAWLLGRHQSSAARPWLGLTMAGLALLGGTVVGVRAAHEAAPALAGAGASEAGTVKWQPWSSARVAALRAEGRPVFVNFTAAWCISCKANELMVFSTDEVKDAFDDLGVATLKADWTNRDEAIARELEAHGRAGVPLYLYYPPGKETPQTLPSVLTKSIVLSYLGR